MTSKINPNVQKLEISGIRQFFNRISHVDDMISLTIGQPDFKTPQHIKDTAIQAINENFTSYTHNAGFIELRQAISSFMNVKYNLLYNPENEIIVTNGASQAIDTALRTVLMPGDEVILPSPVYPGYTPIINQCGAVPVLIDITETQFKLTASQIENAVTPKTKCIILPYPSNPTGVSLLKSELEDIARVVKENDLIIVADEIYSELTYDRKHVSIGTIIKEHTITINGLSKSHAMTGWRIGVLMAPEWIAKECLKVHQYSVSCASSISQKAAIAAFTTGINDALPMRDEYRKRRKLTGDYLKSLNFKTIEPDGAFYYLAGIPSTMSSFDFALLLAEQAKVGVIPGTAFGEHGEGFIRISYACSELSIHLAFERISKFLQNR
ncbi:aminotransferase class I/II-fold pyridoxal phosphate-dependent enzyme [Jeotgalibacillus campisalis]|uniref:Aminotransferase n=1 Tax=Jeotgalibacillus campisalis TaxID=220754 RepID=A0A0C2VSX6_9BACL|nr:aminotransferase class I/II-fold pyridoxal phosphate-dependent enzyme [Jeotgalibacillus campisalis]KIL47521.1 aminotransferase A [Jeotgalibacillus campisalis]